jgi:hypothetical protein
MTKETNANGSDDVSTEPSLHKQALEKRAATVKAEMQKVDRMCSLC